jgi:acyl-CoA synthetase (AMP-forming)/AMP-acid ligase II
VTCAVYGHALVSAEVSCVGCHVLHATWRVALHDAWWCAATSSAQCLLCKGGAQCHAVPRCSVPDVGAVAVLCGGAQVAECAVLGVPDETYGEVVAALVVSKKQHAAEEEGGAAAEGAAEEPIDQVQLRQFCGQSLPPYQVSCCL